MHARIVESPTVRGVDTGRAGPRTGGDCQGCSPRV